MENQFHEGDLVWAKVNHHLWWLGIINHEPSLSTDGKKVESLATITNFDDLRFVERKDGKSTDNHLIFFYHLLIIFYHI
ncbi:putative PWWP domain-containing protein [Helianthus annuus]|nr:putative PWWP domain-containing protein [Helianthus annuus]KAJ0686562.1 putative PWWP domain-containing protein [Helianthus annuus]